MSAPCQDVLLDSNAYFRLGNSIRPLLAQAFGTSPQYSLHVLAELDDEYSTNVRLRHKFEWVSQAEYRNDRRAKRYELRGADRTRALNAFSFLLAYADEQAINLSREDLKALAFAMVHEVPDPARLFADVHRALKPGCKLLLAEPTGHVRANAFETSLEQARAAGLVLESRPTIRRSHAAVLVRA